MRKVWKLSVGSIGAMIVAAQPAWGQVVPPLPQSSGQASDEETVASDIVITGTRRSLQRALEIKRDAPQIIDIVGADDVGKFPDQNVSESLQRITGVQITRSLGEGSGIAVRGLTQNRIEIDGRSLVGTTQGGAVDFTGLNPELYGALEVRKSPTADQIDGALGATINLRTRKPFDFRKPTLAINARADYAELADAVDPRISFLATTRLLDNRLGLLISGSYAKRSVRTDAFTTLSWTQLPNSTRFRPTRLEPQVFERDFERINAFAALQFQASDDWLLGADYNFTSSDYKGLRYRTDYLLTNAVTATNVSANNSILAGTYDGVIIRPLGDVQDGDDDAHSFAAYSDFDRENVHIRFEASHAIGKSDTIQQIVTAQPPGAVIGDGLFQTDTVTIDFVDPNRLPTTRILTNSRDLNNPTQYVYNQALDQGGQSDNRETAVRLDGEYKFDAGLLTALKLGARYSYEDFEFRSINFSTAGNFEIPVDDLPFTFPFPFGSYLSGVQGDFPRSWVSFIPTDVEAMRRRFGYAGRDLTDFLGSSSVRRQTMSAYARADFGGDVGGVSFSGNVGVRYITLNRSSSGFISLPASAGGGFSPTSARRSEEAFLPSVNVNFDLTEKLVLRLAAAKVRAQPSLSALSPGTRIVIITGSSTATAGNPALAAFTSDQADASLEWYFQQGGLLSIAGFYKSVSAFIQNTFTNEIIPGFEQFGVIPVSRPTNAGSGTIKGFEVGYQHQLTFLPGLLNGLGVQANYTFVDSSTPSTGTGGSLPLSGLSKHSYNLVGYYEKGPVTARIAYNWRNKFLFTPFGIAGSPEFVDPYGQLDASIGLKVNEQVELTFNAINITDTILRRYSLFRERPIVVEQTDRRFAIGARVSF